MIIHRQTDTQTHTRTRTAPAGYAADKYKTSKQTGATNAIQVYTV